MMSLKHAVPNVLAVVDTTGDTAAASVALDALLVLCEGATLVVQDGKYYGMRLLMPGQTEPIHPRIIVSATHKWMRQKKSAQLVFMLGCFYTAVWKDSDNASRGSFMGHVTRIQNRFAITILEEGGMQFLDKTAQLHVVRSPSYHIRFVVFVSLFALQHNTNTHGCLTTLLFFVLAQVQALVMIKTCTQLSQWKQVIGHMQRVVSILHVADRGRVISLVKCYAQLHMPCSADEEAVCAVMRQQLEIAWKELLPKVRRTWPAVLPLFAKGLGYRDNAEFCKVAHMCVHCSSIIGQHLVAPFSLFSAYVAGEYPVDNYRVVDHIDDMHTTMRTKASQDVFVYGGCYTEGTSSFVFGGLDIPALQVIYQRKKETDFRAEQAASTAAAVSAAAARARAASLARAASIALTAMTVTAAMTAAIAATVLTTTTAPTIAVTAVVDAASTEPVMSASKALVASPKHNHLKRKLSAVAAVEQGPSPPMDSYYATPEGRICGFKYASLVALMNQTVGIFAKGNRMFVKIGEVLAKNRESQAINVVMSRLGMPYVVEEVVPVVFDTTAWTAHSLLCMCDQTARWGPSMLAMMQRVVVRHERGGLRVHMKISTLFEGVRLGWLDRNERTWCNNVLLGCASSERLGKTLCMVLFVVVYFGVTDSGPFNCMVDAEGHVLLVDISMAHSLRMLKYHGLGLFPLGHKYAPAHIRQVVRYVKNNRSELAEFLVALKASAPPNPHLVMGAQCPFFDNANIAALRSGDDADPYVQYLLQEIQRNPCDKHTVAHPFPAHSHT